MNLLEARPERSRKPDNPFPWLPPGLHRHLTIQVRRTALASRCLDDRGNTLGLVQAVELLPEVSLSNPRSLGGSRHGEEDVVTRRQRVRLELCIPVSKPKFITGGKEDSYCLIKPKMIEARNDSQTNILAVAHELGAFPDLAFVDGLYDPNWSMSWATVDGWASVEFHEGMIPGMYRAQSGDLNWARVEHTVEDVAAWRTLTNQRLQELWDDRAIQDRVGGHV